MLTDLAKEAVLDRVPFGGTARIMTNGHGQLESVGQLFLESQLPGTTARAIAPTAVGKDEQFRGIGVTVATFATPPLAKGFDGELAQSAADRIGADS